MRSSEGTLGAYSQAIGSDVHAIDQSAGVVVTHAGIQAQIQAALSHIIAPGASCAS
jgi:hypothetical protein